MYKERLAKFKDADELRIILTGEAVYDPETKEVKVESKSGERQKTYNPISKIESYQSIDEISEEIIKLLKRKIELRKEEDYAILSGYIMSTYSVELFKSVPYLNINGEFESGKSELGELLSKLCYHGLYVVSPTVSFITRILSKEKITLVIDEFDSLPVKERNALLGVLNSGYKRGAPRGLTREVDVGEGKKERVGELQLCYGFKIIVGAGILKTSLKTRCIEIFTIKKTKHLDKSACADEIETIKGKLLSFRFDMISKNIETLDSFSKQFPPDHSGRLIDIYYPIYVSSPDHIKKIIKNKIDEHRKDDILKSQVNIENKILRCLYLHRDKKHITALDIAKRIADDKNINGKLLDDLKKEIIAKLRSLGFTLTNVTVSRITGIDYSLNRENLARKVKENSVDVKETLLVNCKKCQTKIYEDDNYKQSSEDYYCEDCKDKVYFP
jgi:hypothetical protein